MKTIHTASLSPAKLQSYLQYAIAPRPICMASTVDLEGNVNLSPFSFFNLFSVNPPICIFSPSRRVRDNTTKHTLDNLQQVPECVINIVNYPMVHQTSLSSTEYPRGVNEFVKAGFTEIKSELVRPPRIAESPVQLECIVQQIIPVGDQPGAGNLVLAEIKLIHIREEILDDAGGIDQAKIDLVARLGGDLYCRVTRDNLFSIAKPLVSMGIGVDALHEDIRGSKVLTGNDLGQLGNNKSLPSNEDLDVCRNQPWLREILDSNNGDKDYRRLTVHTLAKNMLDKGDSEGALLVLLAGLK